MNLLQVVKHLQGIALTIPNIRSANEGSVYTIQNGNPHQKYMSFVVSQTTHRTDDLFDYFGLNLFLIDRLTDELEANRLQIQSLAKDCLTNILIKFCNKFYGATYNELVFHPFTEKFTDLCAGQYVQVTLQIPRNIICEDEYSTEYLPNYTLKPLVVEITENGVYEYEPDNFDGYDKVTVTVNVDIPDNFESGFTSGVTYQKSLLENINITNNGSYTSTNGYSAITVNVPQSAYTSGYTQEDLDNTYASGETHQKSLLTDIEITHNGEYEVENGYGKVTVNVPQDSGQTIYNQTKNVEYTQNGEYVVNYDNGYTGLEGVNITVNVPQSAYTSGYTEQDLIDAYNSGITYQKSLLSAINITENGTYSNSNGWSAVTVNVSGDTPTPPTPSGDTSAYTDMYLTTLALDSGIIRFEVQTGQTFMLQYRKNKSEWVSASQGVIENNVVVGDIIEYKSLKGSTYGHFSSNCKFIAYGNAMSLLYGDDFSGKTTFQSTTYTLNGLFIDCSGLTSVKHLVLPATALTQNAYDQMFRGCTNLIDSPELPATKIANWCYKGMFSGCTSLTNAPVLYDVDFGPEGSASPQGAFEDMFKGCSSLNNIKCYISNKTTYPDNEFIFGFWVNGVSPTGTFTKAEGVNWETGISGIPNNWTVIEN